MASLAIIRNSMESQLKELYGRMDTEELLQLHSRGNLTNIAYDVLEAELHARKQIVPDRPLEEEYQESLSPVGFRIIGFVITVIVINMIWVGLLQPLIGGGAIQFLLAVGIPTIITWRLLFPKKRKEQ